MSAKTGVSPNALSDKGLLEQVDTNMLIAAALECALQQAQLLSSDARLSEEEIEKLQELERVRSNILHAIDWRGIDDATGYQVQLRELEALDASNHQLLHKRHDELAQQIKLLKKRRGAVGEYLSIR